VSPSEVKPSDLIRTKHFAPLHSTIQYLDLRTHRKYLDCRYPTCTRRINFLLLVTMPMVIAHSGKGKREHEPGGEEKHPKRPKWNTAAP